jgi:4-hydroxythreonine-4-phosphate dehydrogenase
MAPLRIALTTGEPAGIGPDLSVQLAQEPLAAELIAIGDPKLLADRASQLGLPLKIRLFDSNAPARPSASGEICVMPVALVQPCRPGILDPANADYVLDTLQSAVRGCLAGTFQAMVTAPVQKSIINDAGIPFTGHTEFLAAATNTEDVVMMLACESMRVALVTTHLPLAEVPAAVTRERLSTTISILAQALRDRFQLSRPTIGVLGLNPHAGEGGHMGREEIETITPVLQQLRSETLELLGPLPADTAFNRSMLKQCDAMLAMYHDQGLPVLKYAGFGNAVNITLGLPIIRTSVDHGTALGLAGSGRADLGSLRYAVACASEMAATDNNRIPA